jgi:hypothetical protein
MKKFLHVIRITLLLAGVAGCYDDGNLWNSVNELEEKVQALEEKVNRANNDIASIKTIVDALNAGKVITHVAETTTGYTITLSDGNTLTLLNGTPGADAPIVGVAEEGGAYYWTLTTGDVVAWLTNASGQKLPVTGADGSTPVMDVDDDGYWTVNGTRVTGADDQPVKAAGADGDSFFSDVTVSATAVTFTLADGTLLALPVADAPAVTADESLLFIRHGETREVPLAFTGAATLSIVKPDGWKASVRGDVLSVTAPPLANTFAEKEGTIDIIAVGKTTTTTSIRVSARDYSSVIDFEDARVEDYLAGPTAKGENLYEGFTDAPPYYRYYGYDDPAGLVMPLNDYNGMLDPEFWNGGVAISRWNNMTTKGQSNQCSVYYSDATTGRGGHDGSATFAVVYGYNDPMWDSRASILVTDDVPRVFDHFYVSNSTWSTLVTREGDGYARALTYANHDWLKLVIEGRVNGVSTGATVECYLADFRESTSPGVITGWQPVDLSALGAVTSLVFDLQGTDLQYGGLASPAYFCFDDLALR